MRQITPCLALLALAWSLAVIPVSSAAAPGGKMSVLPLGIYSCGLPGDALTSVRDIDDDRGFHIVVGSSYAVGEMVGNYLLTGDTVQMSNGPMKGRTFIRESEYRLRETTSGRDPDTLCIRTRPLPKG